MKLLTFVFTLFAIASFGVEVKISKQELKEDKELVEEINKRLDKLDEKIRRGDHSTEVIDQLNSFGHPLYVLRQKYLDYNEPQYGEYYKTYFKILDTQEKLFYVKRGLLPSLVKKEAKEQNLPVCNVSVRGEKRKTLVINLKNPERDEEIKEVLDRTQVRYAHLIGIEELSFERCK